MKVEKLMKVNKIKQKSKAAKKRMNNKKKKEPDTKSQAVYKIPNLKNIPHGCRHLVKEGDLVYEVPGDGACYPNSSAAFIFHHDEVFGPKLRKRINNFFVIHCKSKYQSICLCSEETPFIRMTSKGEVKYEDPEKLFEFPLSHDEKATYMWSVGYILTKIWKSLKD